MLSKTRPDCSRAKRSSGCSKIERMAEAINFDPVVVLPTQDDGTGDARVDGPPTTVRRCAVRHATRFAIGAGAAKIVLRATRAAPTQQVAQVTSPDRRSRDPIGWRPDPAVKVKTA